MNRKWLAASLFSASCFIGCHSDREGPPPPRAVVVEPGYYYDAEYRDQDGRDHPRTFWYYDGHQYTPHDAPPPNVVVHERHLDAHENHPGDFHEGDRDVPGEQLHGGEVNHDDRPGPDRAARSVSYDGRSHFHSNRSAPHVHRRWRR